MSKKEWKEGASGNYSWTVDSDETVNVRLRFLKHVVFLVSCVFVRRSSPR